MLTRNHGEITYHLRPYNIYVPNLTAACETIFLKVNRVYSSQITEYHISIWIGTSRFHVDWNIESQKLFDALEA